MSWTSVKTAVKVAIASASGLSPAAISWAGRPIGALNSVAMLDIISAPQEGFDRISRTEGAGQNFDVEVSASVVFTVAVRLENVTGDALDLVELVRSGLAFPSVLSALESAGVVLVGFPGPPVPVRYVNDSRDVSAYVLDVVFRSVFYRTDPIQQTTIEHVEGSGEIANDPDPAVVVNFEANRE